MANNPPRKGRTGKKPGQIPPPKCKAFLLCQGTIIEQGSGNVTIINTFNAFGVPQFPGQTGPFVIFIQLTDGVGEYDAEIEIVDLKDDRTIARAVAPAKMKFPNKLARMNVLIPIPALPIPHGGSYEIRVLANKQLIERQRFDVVKTEVGK
jgi:hypothetical protein